MSTANSANGGREILESDLEVNSWSKQGASAVERTSGGASGAEERNGSGVRKSV